MEIDNTKKEESCRQLEELLKDSKRKFLKYIDDFHKKEIHFPAGMRDLINCNQHRENDYFFDLKVFAYDKKELMLEDVDAKKFIDNNPEMLVFPLDLNIGNRINPYKLVGKGRYSFSFGEGLLGKVKPTFCLGHYLKPGFYIGTKTDFTGANREEILCRLMQEHGFTKENGFLLPFHYCVALDLDSNNQLYASVLEYNCGFIKSILCTVTEDMSLGYDYVTDIVPYHFTYLKNRTEFAASYIKHMETLVEFFKLPKISGTINRNHSRMGGNLDSVILALSRMLLVRIKDRVGEIFIGDLDHIAVTEYHPDNELDEYHRYNVGQILAEIK